MKNINFNQFILDREYAIVIFLKRNSNLMQILYTSNHDNIMSTKYDFHHSQLIF